MADDSGNPTGDLTAGAGIALSAATGNWIGAAIGAVGLGMSIVGSISGAMDSSKYSSQEVANSQAQSKVSQDEATQEQNINNLKQQQMYLDANRQNMQTVRTAQQKQALGLNNAVNQGAQFGSGYAGGQAQIKDQAMFNMQGVNQALQIGAGINSFNQNITNDKYQMFGLQSQEASIKGSATSAMAVDQGFTSLGGAVMKAGPIIGQFSQGFGMGSTASAGGGGVGK